jgi:hypothetical protein
MKIRPLEAEFFHTDIQTDMKKVIIAFRNFTNLSNNALLYVHFIYCICMYIMYA